MAKFSLNKRSRDRDRNRSRQNMQEQMRMELENPLRMQDPAPREQPQLPRKSFQDRASMDLHDQMKYDLRQPVENPEIARPVEMEAGPAAPGHDRDPGPEQPYGARGRGVEMMMGPESTGVTTVAEEKREIESKGTPFDNKKWGGVAGDLASAIGQRAPADFSKMDEILARMEKQRQARGWEAAKPRMIENLFDKYKGRG